MTSVRHITPDADPRAGAAGTDDRYLDAAREAILAVGWSRATLTDVARRAGVSRMTLYRRWSDTRALLSDLMLREWDAVVRRAAATAADEGGDGLDVLVATVVRTAAGLRDDPLLRRIVEVDPDLLLPYLLQRPGRVQERLVDDLSSSIAELQRQRAARPGAPHRLARSLVLACQGFVLSAGIAAADSDPAAYDDELAALVRGYLSPAAGR